jgi:hypothetical protein
MVDQLPIFDMTVRGRGRIWKWHVTTLDGRVIMKGSAKSRRAAQYGAYRALLLLWMTAPGRLPSSELA